jgi:hypothetical protein
VKIGAIYGDDVYEQVQQNGIALNELASSGIASQDIVSAHAYIGADPIVSLLGQGCQIIFGGRIADSSLFVAPICHELGIALDDWHRIGQAAVAGHLLECGTHLTGSNYADPPFRTVPNPTELGQPFAQVDLDGAVFTKLDDAGGLVDEQVVKLQLMYEILDPSKYLTPDICADFTQVTVEEVGPNQVRVSGGTGTKRPDNLKVLVGVDLGWKVFGEVSYGGPGCVDRARLCEEIMRNRLAEFGDDIDEVIFDYHGLTSLYGGKAEGATLDEVRLRIALRCHDAALANRLHEEMDLLYVMAPAGASGVTRSMQRAVGVTPAYLDRSLAPIREEVLVS